jgi:hypothetical protein
MSTAWLQFSTLLNGICIGGRLAHFQATDPGATLSKTCNSTHLHYHIPNENCCASLQRLCTTTSHQTLDWVPSPLQHCSTFEMQSLTALTSELEDHLQVEDTQFMIFIISLQAPTSLSHQRSQLTTQNTEQISKIAERTPQHLEGNMTIISSCNLMRVTHKMSDQHLHHEQQQQAAMTSHWLHQLLMLGVDRNITICLKFQVNQLYKHLPPEILSHFWKQWEDSVMILGGTQQMQPIKQANSILSQAATSLCG